MRASENASFNDTPKVLEKLDPQKECRIRNLPWGHLTESPSSRTEKLMLHLLKKYFKKIEVPLISETTSIVCKSLVSPVNGMLSVPKRFIQLILQIKMRSSFLFVVFLLPVSLE